MVYGNYTNNVTFPSSNALVPKVSVPKVSNLGALRPAALFQPAPKPNVPTVASDALLIPESPDQLAAISLKTVSPFQHPNYSPVADPIAKLAPKEPLPVAITTRVATTWDTITAAVQGKPVTDQHMAETSMTLRQLGSAGIAGLAALSTGSLLLGAKEALGALSFVGVGMLAPIALIDGVLKQKTGLDFNEKYITSYNDGERKALFNDPYYLPTQVLPAGQISQAAKRLGVPQRSHDESQERENRKVLSQALTQRWSLWMLTAGGLTPLLGSWTAHLLEPLMENPLLQSKAWVKQQQVKALSAMASPQQKAKLAATFAHNVLGVSAPGSSTAVANSTDSLLAMWWRNLGPSLLKRLSLPRETFRNITNPLEKAEEEEISRHFLRMDAKERGDLKTILNRQSETLLRLSERFKQGLLPQEESLRHTLANTVQKLLTEQQKPLPTQWLETLKNQQEALTLPKLAEAFKQLTALNLEEKSLHAIDSVMTPLEQVLEVKEQGFHKLMNAMATLAHYNHGLEEGERFHVEWMSLHNDAKRKLLRPLRDTMEKANFSSFKELSDRFLEKPVLERFGPMHYPPLQQLMGQFGQTSEPSGYLNYVKQLVMNPDNLKQRFRSAYEVFGKLPVNHLIESLTEESQKSLWRRNTGVATLTLLGGSALAASLWVGRSSKTREEQSELLQLLNLSKNSGGLSLNQKGNLLAPSASLLTKTENLNNPTQPPALSFPLSNEASVFSTTPLAFTLSEKALAENALTRLADSKTLSPAFLPTGGPVS